MADAAGEQPDRGLEVRVHVAAESASALRSWIERQAGQPTSLVVVIGSQEPAPPRPLVHNPEQAAKIIGGSCKASWLKTQARIGKIPSIKIGGAYNFTDEDVAEVIRIFKGGPPIPEAPPPTPALPSSRAAAVVLPQPVPGREHVQLVARTSKRVPRGKRGDS